jgi:hypothetical protein
VRAGYEERRRLERDLHDGVDAVTCVLGPDAAGPAAPPWMVGLMARSDGLDRRHHGARHAPGGPCADVPDWLRALILRSDAMNRAGSLGRYAPTQ